MSEFSCPIVEIKGFGKHPNADSLSITNILGNTVIFKTEDFKVGDRAVFVPEEALLPDSPLFSFVWANRTNEGKKIEDRHRVVWARRLRNIFSTGLIIKPTDEMKELPVGTDVMNLLGITKWEQPEAACTGGDNAPQQGCLIKFTEIENIKRYHTHLIVGEQVISTEKVHGSNMRTAWHDGQNGLEFFIGSHTNIKCDDDHNVWSKVSRRIDLPNKLKKYPEYIYFGEVFGTVQKGYNYGLKHADFILFDIFDLKEKKYLDWEQVKTIAQELGLNLVPVLYEGPWISLEHIKQFADGPTVVGGGKHNREGCVVRTVPERFDDHIGRMCLKSIGEDYLLKKKSNA